MAHRKMTPIEEIPLVGGRLCLDFVNTTGARRSEEPRERIQRYHDLLTWAQRADLLTEEEVVELVAEADRRSEEAETALQLALDIRETLYDALRPLAEDERPAPGALSALDALLLEAARRRMLRTGPDGVEWSWSRDPEKLEWFLWPVVHSAEGTLLAGDLSKLKRCGECDWLFLDETRNRSRRWCKKLCGDRVRARRYYRRQKET